MLIVSFYSEGWSILVSLFQRWELVPSLPLNYTVGQRLLEFRDLFFADRRSAKAKPSKALQICQRGQVADRRPVEVNLLKALQIRQRA